MWWHAQKPDFIVQRNGWVHLNLQGRQFSRLLVAEVCASAVVMLDTPCSKVVWRVLATHSIRQFPFTSLPCVTVCHHVSTGFYLIFNEAAVKNCTQGLGCHMEVPLLTSTWRESSFATRSWESNFSNNNGMQNSVKSGEAIRQGKRAAARSSRVMPFGVLGICCREIHSCINLSAKWTKLHINPLALEMVI